MSVAMGTQYFGESSRFSTNPPLKSEASAGLARNEVHSGVSCSKGAARAELPETTDQAKATRIDLGSMLKVCRCMYVCV